MTSFASGLPAYDVEEEIGRDDLTISYRAHRTDDGLPVTVKVIAPQFASDRYLARRFVEAGERATRLDHPNIARVYEVGHRQDVVFVVREWIQDECLAERLGRTGPMSPAETTGLVHQLASALDYAHSQRVMHGDLNDRCVFIGDEGHATIADFGLAQSLAGTDSMDHVQWPGTAHSMGTPEYLSSERAQGQGANRAADIYALGVLAYQLLAGRVPFVGEPADVLNAQVHETPPPLHSLNPSVPVAISEVVARALAKRPEMRFNTATVFARALAAAEEGNAPASASAAAGRSRGLKLWQRPIFWAVVVAPVIGLFLAMLIWNLAGWGERQASRLAEILPTLPPYTPAAGSGSDVTALTATLAPLATPALTQTPALSPSPSPTPIFTPAAVTVAEGSPFSNLVVARGIGEDHQPLSVGSDFPSSSQPVYLFFDYRGMSPDTRWGHVWIWGNLQLDRSITGWPEDWGTAGTAWVFYTPEGGYQPGPYEVRLLVNDQVVASASFVMR